MQQRPSADTGGSQQSLPFPYTSAAIIAMICLPGVGRSTESTTFEQNVSAIESTSVYSRALCVDEEHVTCNAVCMLGTRQDDKMMMMMTMEINELMLSATIVRLPVQSDSFSQ
jgi:hypothetical protein